MDTLDKDRKHGDIYGISRAQHGTLCLFYWVFDAGRTFGVH
jgi:hypothetical protein